MKRRRSGRPPRDQEEGGRKESKNVKCMRAQEGVNGLCGTERAFSGGEVLDGGSRTIPVPPLPLVCAH